ncbi:MAG: helix-turn-helix domain-containing protein [Desulfuromonadales bacterium]|nr:helix-turn-helix domain-containing protein [Desulfuromonadales bacterium]
MKDDVTSKVFKRQDMLTVSQLAKRIGCSRRHAYYLVERGEEHGGVRAFRFGVARCLRIPASEVERLKSCCTVEEV